MTEGRRSLDVLVADDNPTNRLLMRILLERAGHRVTIVEDGARAVEAVSAGGIDLVLMDVLMPGMDGLEATRRIRALADPALAATTILAVTAGAMRKDAARASDAGMDGIVTKPVTMASLAEAIARNTAAGAARTRPNIS